MRSQKFETKGIRLDPGLKFMVTTLAAEINGCGFCVDIARAMAIREHLGMEKFNALGEYRTSPLFSGPGARSAGLRGGSDPSKARLGCYVRSATKAVQ